MKECTQLTCNRPSDSWKKLMKKKVSQKKVAKGRGQGKGAKEPLFPHLLSPSYSFPRLFSFVLHFTPLSTIICPLRLEQTSSQCTREFFPMQMQRIHRCPLRSIQHFKSSYSCCNYSCLSKTPHFFLFSVLLYRKVFGDLFLIMVFHPQSKRVKTFSETFLTKYLYSAMVILRNVHVYLYMIS